MRSSPQCPPPWWRGFNSADDLRNIRKAVGLSKTKLAKLAVLERHAVLYHEKRKGRVDGVAPYRFRQVFERMGIAVPGWREPAFPAPVKTGNQQARAVCGARTRKGTPCRCKPDGRGGRCKFHGGMSTGPKTPEGKARIVAARRVRAELERISIGAMVDQ